MGRSGWQTFLSHRHTSFTSSPCQALLPKGTAAFQHRCLLKGKLQHRKLGETFEILNGNLSLVPE